MGDEPTTPPPAGDPPVKPPEKPPEPPKPPETPKYEPPDDVRKSVEYYKRDVADKGGAKLQGLLDGLHEAGIEIIPGAGGPDPEQTARLDKLEREIAKRDAALEFGLTGDDVKILDGTPVEIRAKAEYLSKRIVKDKPGETPGKPGDTPPPKSGTPPSTPPPTFERYNVMTGNPKEAQKQAEATMNELIAKGEGFGFGGQG